MALVLLLIAQCWRTPAPPSPSQPLAEGPYQLKRVVDGDTIIVSPEAVIRLIGVNTPETVRPEWPVEPWGPEATAFTKHFLAGGIVRLSFDRERVDHYGRFLAYAWVGDEMLNEALLRAGLARYEPQFRYSESVKLRFRKAEQDAKQEGLGIWSGERVR